MRLDFLELVLSAKGISFLHGLLQLFICFLMIIDLLTSKPYFKIKIQSLMHLLNLLLCSVIGSFDLIVRSIVGIKIPRWGVWWFSGKPLSHHTPCIPRCLAPRGSQVLIPLRPPNTIGTLGKSFTHSCL